MKEYIEELLPVYLEIISQYPDVTMNTLERGGWALKLIKSKEMKN